MRVLLTADLHFNHGRSRALAEQIIDRINAEQFDLLVLVGDTAPAESPDLGRGLTRFTFPGPKLFIAGNHDLWTESPDPDASYRLFTHDLPQRLRDFGWTWGEGTWAAPDRSLAVVGSIGWYDYSFAPESLAVPRRFYEAKMSPGAARYNDLTTLFENHPALPDDLMDFYARWNDGRFIKLGRPDETFLNELLTHLEASLQSVADVPKVIAAIHHVPFPQLLPPEREGRQWAFARAYLGSPKIGALLARFPNVRELYCGHSHFPADATIGHIKATNIGAGYRGKRYVISEP